MAVPPEGNWSISGGTTPAAATATPRAKTAPHAAHPHGRSNTLWWPVVDTTTVPNGPYKYCVQALTIAGVSARRCTAVTIAN